jgi:hypothetical protein
MKTYGGVDVQTHLFFNIMKQNEIEYLELCKIHQ